MKNMWKFVENIFFIAGFPVACLVGYIMAGDIIFFWQHGVEKQVMVKHILQERHGVKSTSYDYLFEMEGQEVSRIFADQLQVGERVEVLVSPNNSEDFILGNKDLNLFELFSLNIGGKAVAIFLLVVYLIIIYATLFSMVRWMKNRGKCLEG